MMWSSLRPSGKACGAGGISFDYQSVSESPTSGKARSTHLYGVVNLDYEWLKGTQTDIAGTPVFNRGRALWGGVSVGASVNWSDTITVYAEGTGETALRDFGGSYGLRGTAGARVRF